MKELRLETARIPPSLPSNIATLTSIRFFAAFWVVIYHFRDQLPFDIDNTVTVFRRGTLAVDLFFILSGFVLAHAYGPALDAKRFSYREFLSRRLARIYPVHIATLLGTVAVYLALTAVHRAPNNPEKYDVAALLPNLLLIHAWGTTDHLTWNMPSWSISAEWFAYLLFPAFVWCVLRTKRSTVTVFALTLGVLLVSELAAWALVHHSLTGLQYGGGNLRIVPEFALGMMLRRAATEFSLPPRWRAPTMLLMAGLAILFIEMHLPDLLVLLCWGALIFAAADMSRGPATVLSSRPLVYLGEISYSVYMCHALVQTVFFNGLTLVGVRAPAAVVVAWFISLGVVVAVSAAAYALIEVPGRRFLTRFLIRRDT